MEVANDGPVGEKSPALRHEGNVAVLGGKASDFAVGDAYASLGFGVEASQGFQEERFAGAADSGEPPAARVRQGEA